MAKLYPPVTEDVLSAFCLNYNSSGEKTGATIKVSFNLNRAVTSAEISGIALRLRTISTNQYVVTENLAINEELNKSEGIALSYDLSEGTAIFQITNTYNSDSIDALRVGQYYKAQIAFIDLNGTVGYWSTVSTIKCVAKPSVIIANFNPNDANIFMTEIVGEYIQDTTTGDSSEKVYSYRFQLWDSQENLIEDTGVQLHNSSIDVSSNSSTDIFYCYKELNDNESYYIEYSVTTINGLNVSSPRYQIINAESIDPEEDIGLIAYSGLEEDYYDKYKNVSWAPWEEGVIKIYIDFNDPKDRGHKQLTGNYVILRSSSKDNFSSWQEIRRLRLNDVIPSQEIIYDYTVEQGISYRYALQQFNRQSFYSKKIYSYKRNNNMEILYNNRGDPIINEIKADFEDMFLYDGERQLKIRFNPKVNTFKNDLQEQKIDTIGSKHPFIFRNGNVCYKEFSIAGLISFQEDNALFFINDEDYEQMGLDRFGIPSGELTLRHRADDANYKYVQISSFRDITRQNYQQLYIQENKEVNIYEDSGSHENLLNRSVLNTVVQTSYKQVTSYDEAYQLYRDGNRLYKKVTSEDSNYQDIYRGTVYSKTDLTSENMMSERYFKLAVLDWLTDGKPKLFRSPAEGNYIVRLLNVSLTPKAELGRMLHEFTCTAYEVADFNYQSLVNFGLLSVMDMQKTEYQWHTKNITDLNSFELMNPDENGDRYYSVNLENKELYNFQCTGFAPGDKIKLIFADDVDPLIITIGQTGTYIYEDSRPIVSFGILPQNNTGDFSRNLLLGIKGYRFQIFDTIASISTSTEIGTQLVGPVDNFFKKEVVGMGSNYYKTPNVDLMEPKYIEKTLSVNSYRQGRYYIKNENNEYIICADKNFDSSKVYYALEEYPKLKVSELLYLHAKRREVIPIFMANSPNSANQYYITGLQNQAEYMLTPYGNGFINYKSISNHDEEWIRGVNLYDQLTPEERTRKMSINELVQFTIQKCHLDNFCLFKVFIPNGNGEWVFYNYGGGDSYNGSDFIYGIFDPYLYEQQTKEKINSPLNGWWVERNSNQKSQLYYNPTFILEYGDGLEQEISLDDTIEIILQNIRVPTKLQINNGVMAEVIYRIQSIDYSIENEKSIVKNAKNDYLTTKEEAVKNISLYRTAQLAKLNGEILYEKYTQLVGKIKDYEMYTNVIGYLTDAAYEEQIEIITAFLNNEKALVNNVVDSLYRINIDLLEMLSQDFSSDYNFYSEYNLIDFNNEYNTTIERYFNDTLLPNREEIEQMGNNNVEQIIINKVNEYLNNVVDLEEIFTKVLRNLTSEVENINQELIDLGAKQYVAQYLDYLEETGKKLLLIQPFDDFDASDIFKNEYIQYLNSSNVETILGKPLGDIIHKKLSADSSSSYEDIALSLLNSSITSSEWDTIFHISNDILNEFNTGDDIINYLSDKEFCNIIIDETKWQEITNNCRFTTSPNDYKLLTIIKFLEDEATHIDVSTSENDYSDKWGVQYESNLPAVNLFGENHTASSNVDLGYINENNYTINKCLLENFIDQQFNDQTSGFIAELFVDNRKAEAISIIKERLLTHPDNIFNLYGFDGNGDLQEIKNINNSSNLSLLDYLAELIFNYIKTGSRDLFRQAFACYTYWVEHKNELTEAQVNIIKNQIAQCRAQIIDANHLDYNNEIPNPYFKNFVDEYNEWWNDYTSVNNESKQNMKQAIQETLEQYRNCLNSITNVKIKALEKFRELRQKIIDIENSDITVSDNIKTILWEEKEAINNISAQIKDLQEYFISQHDALESTMSFNAYIDFLKTYLDARSTTQGQLTNEQCQQLLQEADAMRRASTNEENSPTAQNKKIQEKWKIFLDVLATAYKAEVKERVDS